MTRRTAIVAGACAALAVIAAAFAADAYYAHGIEVTWRATPPPPPPPSPPSMDAGVGAADAGAPDAGAPAGAAEAEAEPPEAERIVVIDRSIEHRTSFHNPHRVLGRYVQEWPFGEWGVPNAFPPLDVVIRARIEIPEGPPLYVGARSPNETDVLIDGLRANEPVEPGVHDLTVYWHGPLHPEGATHWTTILPAWFQLEWGTDPEELESVPRTALTIPDGVPNPARVWLFVLASLLGLLLGFAVYSIARSPKGVARAQAFVLATALILLLGLGLRAWDYDVVPEFRENMDELFATWNGYGLLEDGTTQGWTLWPARYVGLAELERVEYFRERPITVVRPYFEHPPLLHLMVGAAAHLGGAEHFLHARLRDTRIVPIGLGVLTILLVVLVTRRLSPTGPAPWFAGLVYATMPHAVIMNRVIKEEALLAPLALGMIFFFLRWRDDGERSRDLVIAAVLAGLCTLTKVPGAVFALVLPILVARHGRLKAAAIAVAVGAAVSSLLLAYAAAIDWELFWYATRDQATIRNSVFQEFVPFFFDSLINHNRVGRGWLIFLWLAFVAACAVRLKREGEVVVLPTIGYLVAMGLASGGWHYGWYLLPVEPLLCIGAGWFLADLWKRPELLRGTLFILLPVAYGMAFVLDPKWYLLSVNYDAMRRWVGSFVIVLLVPYGLVTLWNQRLTLLVARATTALAFALAVLLNAWFALRYDVIYESHQNLDDVTLCDRCEEMGAIGEDRDPAQVGSGLP